MKVKGSDWLRNVKRRGMVSDDGIGYRKFFLFFLNFRDCFREEVSFWKSYFDWYYLNVNIGLIEV